jgi:hypothetical protein
VKQNTKQSLAGSNTYSNIVWYLFLIQENKPFSNNAYPKIILSFCNVSLPQKGQNFGFFTVEIPINWNFNLQRLQ